MNTGHMVQRPSRVVPIVVAIVGAVGLVVAAMITSGVFDEDEGTLNDDGAVTTTETVPETVPETVVPRIDGRYYLDAGNQRTILVRLVDDDQYVISEELPADWPFDGTVTYSGVDTFEGEATFASGETMNVTMRVMPNGNLDTAFEFTDVNGAPTGRIDPHVLVPAE